MHGKRIRLYYRGIIKRCTNCFGAHQRKNCKEEKVPWIKYVEKFINNYPEIPKEFYGRWANMIDGMRPEKETEKKTTQNQDLQSTSAGGCSKQDTPKPPITEEEAQETENENEQEIDGLENSDDVRQLLDVLAATGISVKSAVKMIEGNKKKTNPQKKGNVSGRGRGGKTRPLKK
jgi:hypothetical protein